MKNLLIGLLILFLINYILINCNEKFNLYEEYIYPLCGKSNLTENEIILDKCFKFKAINGFKQPPETYYKQINGSKSQCLELCQKDEECNSIDYDNINKIGYLSKKSLNQSCMFKQSSNKYTHFSKTNNLINKTIKIKGGHLLKKSPSPPESKKQIKFNLQKDF